MDYLALFLNPPSVEPVYRQRLQAWLHEDTTRINARLAAAAQELADVRTKANFDHILVNDDFEQAYEDLKTIVSHFRPDIVLPNPAAQPPARLPGAPSQVVPMTPRPGATGRLDRRTGPNERAAMATVAEQVPEQAPEKPGARVLVLCGPAAAGREALVAQLLSSFPQRLAAPKRLSDRKPGKGDKEGQGVELVKTDVIQKHIQQVGGWGLQLWLAGLGRLGLGALSLPSATPRQ
jgi:guanylate kinase